MLVTALVAAAGLVTTQLVIPLSQASAATVKRPLPGLRAGLSPAVRPHLPALPRTIRGQGGIRVLAPGLPKPVHRAARHAKHVPLPPEKTGSYRVSPAVSAFLSQGLGLPVPGRHPMLTGTRSGRTLTADFAVAPKLRLGLPSGVAAPSFSRARAEVDEATNTITLTATARNARLSVTITHASTATLAGGTEGSDLASRLTLPVPVPVPGHAAASLAGSLGYAPGHPASVALTGSLPGGGVLDPGRAELGAGTKITLTTAGGLRISGPAELGPPGHALHVTVDGALRRAGDWTLTAAGGPGGAALLPGLALAPGVTGTVTDDRGHVAYDIRARAAGTWAPLPGVSLAGGTVEFADTQPGPDMLAAPGAAGATPWADVTGLVTVGRTAGAHGTLAANLSTGRGVLAATDTAPVVLATTPARTVLTGASFGGPLTIGSAAIHGSVRGTGRMTVSPAHHAPVSTDATLGLTPAGTLTAGFPVDRAALGLGSAGWRDTGFWASAATTAGGFPGGRVSVPAGLSAAAPDRVTASPAQTAVPGPVAPAAPTPAAKVTTANGTGTSSYTLSSGVYNFITKTLGIPLGSSPDVTGSLSGDTLTLTVGSPGQLPLSLPAGITAPVFGSTTVTIDESTNTITLQASATAGVTAALQVTISAANTSAMTDGTDLSSTLTFSNVPFLGGSVSLAGSLGYNGTTLSASVTGTLTSNLTFANGAVTLQQGTSITLATGTGLQVQGSATFGTGTYALDASVTGSLTSLSNWSLSATAAGTQTWQPTRSLQLNPTFNGTVSDTNGTVGFDISVSSATGSAITWTPGANASVNVTSLEISNQAPSGSVSCASAITAGDLWIDAKGGFTFTTASSTSISAEACIDLTAQSFSLDTTAPASLDALTGNSLFSISNASLTATGNIKQSTFNVTGSATITVTGVSSQPTLQASVSFGTDGVIAAVSVPDLSKLSSYLAGSGTLYVSSKAVSNFDPTTVGQSGAKFDLPKGLAITLSYQIPQQLLTLLGQIGIPSAALSNASAQAVATLGTSGFSIGLSLNLGTDAGGAQVINSGGFQFYLDSFGVTFAAGTSGVSVSVDGGGYVVLPAVLPGGTSSAVEVTADGSFTASDGGFSASLGLSFGNWDGAFGVSGLDIQGLAAQFGISDDLPTFGFTAQNISLPANVETAIGMNQSSLISFAANLSVSSPILQMSITGSPALTPLSLASSNPSVINSFVIDSASVYIAPTGGNIGTVQFQPGFSVSFDAAVVGVQVDVNASIDPTVPSLSASASVSSFYVGPVQVSNPMFSLNLSPTNLGLQVSGGVSTDGFSASAAVSLQAGSTENGASISLSVTAGVPSELSSLGVASISGSLSGSISGNASASGSSSAVSFSVYGSGYLYAGGGSLGPVSFGFSVPGSFDWSAIEQSAEQVAQFFLDNAGQTAAQVQQILDNLGQYQGYEVLDALGALGQYGQNLLSDVEGWFNFSYYDIWNATSSGSLLVLDVSGASQSPNGQVITWPWNGGYNQEWSFVPVYDGWYQIVNRNSGQCLSVSGPSTSPGADLVQYPCFGGNNQLWYMGSISLDTDYGITSAYDGQVIDIQNAYPWQGGTLDQWPWNGGWNQQFYLTNS